MKILAISVVAALALAVPASHSTARPQKCHVKYDWMWNLFPRFTLDNCPGARGQKVVL